MCPAFDFIAQTVCCGRPPRHERGQANGNSFCAHRVGRSFNTTHTHQEDPICVWRGFTWSSSSSRGGWWFWFWWFRTVTHEHGFPPLPPQIDRTPTSPAPLGRAAGRVAAAVAGRAAAPAAPGRATVLASSSAGVKWCLAHGAGFPLHATPGARGPSSAAAISSPSPPSTAAGPAASAPRSFSARPPLLPGLRPLLVAPSPLSPREIGDGVPGAAAGPAVAAPPSGVAVTAPPSGVAIAPSSSSSSSTNAADAPQNLDTAARRGVQQPSNPLTAQRAFVSARAVFTPLACKADAEVGFWVIVIRIFASSRFAVIVVNLTSRPARRAPRGGSVRPCGVVGSTARCGTRFTTRSPHSSSGSSAQTRWVGRGCFPEWALPRATRLADSVSTSRCAPRAARRAPGPLAGEHGTSRRRARARAQRVRRRRRPKHPRAVLDVRQRRRGPGGGGSRREASDENPQAVAEDPRAPCPARRARGAHAAGRRRQVAAARVRRRAQPETTTGAQSRRGGLRYRSTAAGGRSTAAGATGAARFARRRRPARGAAADHGRRDRAVPRWPPFLVWAY